MEWVGILSEKVWNLGSWDLYFVSIAFVGCKIKYDKKEFEF